MAELELGYTPLVIAANQSSFGAGGKYILPDDTASLVANNPYEYNTIMASQNPSAYYNGTKAQVGLGGQIPFDPNKYNSIEEVIGANPVTQKGSALATTAGFNPNLLDHGYVLDATGNIDMTDQFNIDKLGVSTNKGIGLSGMDKAKLGLGVASFGLGLANYFDNKKLIGKQMDIMDANRKLAEDQYADRKRGTANAIRAFKGGK